MVTKFWEASLGFWVKSNFKGLCRSHTRSRPEVSSLPPSKPKIINKDMELKYQLRMIQNFGVIPFIFDSVNTLSTG